MKKQIGKFIIVGLTSLATVILVIAVAISYQGYHSQIPATQPILSVTRVASPQITDIPNTAIPHITGTPWWLMTPTVVFDKTPTPGGIEAPPMPTEPGLPNKQTLEAPTPVWHTPTPLPTTVDNPGEGYFVQNLTFRELSRISPEDFKKFSSEGRLDEGTIVWSPSGDRFVVGILDTRPIANKWTDIRQVLFLSNGTPSKILAPGQWPVWSPDGRFIAYMVWRSEVQSAFVEIINVETSETQLVAKLAKDTPVTRFAWLSGTELAYTNEIPQIYDVIKRQSTAIKLSVPSVCDSQFRQYAVAQDESLIALGSSSCVLIASKSSSGYVQTAVLSGTVGGLDTFLFSPSSDAIAYVSEGGKLTINIIGNVSEIVKIELPLPISGNAYSIGWSPDGRSLMFIDSDGVFIVNRDGSGLHRVDGAPSPARLFWDQVSGAVLFDLGTEISNFSVTRRQ